MIKLQATVALIFISLNLGCITGITNGYNRLSKEQKERISFDELNSKARFLAINGKEMRKKILSLDTTVVHLWIPYCEGVDCKPINLIKKKLDEKGYNYFIVGVDYTELFDAVKEQRIQEIIYYPNHIYYKTTNRKKLGNFFILDLVGSESFNSEIFYNLYLKFYKGKLLGYTSDLEKLFLIKS